MIMIEDRMNERFLINHLDGKREFSIDVYELANFYLTLIDPYIRGDHTLIAPAIVVIFTGK